MGMVIYQLLMENIKMKNKNKLDLFDMVMVLIICIFASVLTSSLVVFYFAENEKDMDSSYFSGDANLSFSLIEEENISHFIKIDCSYIAENVTNAEILIRENVIELCEYYYPKLMKENENSIHI